MQLHLLAETSNILADLLSETLENTVDRVVEPVTTELPDYDDEIVDYTRIGVSDEWRVTLKREIDATVADLWRDTLGVQINRHAVTGETHILWTETISQGELNDRMGY